MFPARSRNWAHHLYACQAANWTGQCWGSRRRRDACSCHEATIVPTKALQNPRPRHGNDPGPSDEKRVLCLSQITMRTLRECDHASIICHQNWQKTLAHQSQPPSVRYAVGGRDGIGTPAQTSRFRVFTHKRGPSSLFPRRRDLAAAILDARPAISSRIWHCNRASVQQTSLRPRPGPNHRLEDHVCKLNAPNRSVDSRTAPRPAPAPKRPPSGVHSSVLQTPMYARGRHRTTDAHHKAQPMPGPPRTRPSRRTETPATNNSAPSGRCRRIPCRRAITPLERAMVSGSR